MKSEIFVVNAVKSSERAFSAVAEHINCQDRESLLKVLQNPEKISHEARQLGIPREELFMFLAQAIHGAYQRPSISRLTREHIKILLEGNIQRLLSQMLGCSPQDVLQEIFSVPALQESLDYLGGHASGMPANAKLLLNEILKPNNAQQLEINNTATANDWERIVESEGWIEPASAKKLAAISSAQNVGNPYLALAELIDKCGEMLSSESSPRTKHPDQIDALGLLEIRRRLSRISGRLYEQSIDISENIVSSQLDSPIMKLLASMIYIYELGYVAKGIEHFISSSYKLQDILPENDFFGFPVDEQKINNTQVLIYSEEKTFTLHGEPVGNFEIKCLINKAEQTLLKVNGAPFWVCQQLKKDIPNLLPQDLNPLGEHLYERLLNTSFPIVQAEMTRLKEGVTRLGPTFIQAIVLCSDGTIKAIPNAWGDPIQAKLPFDELPVKLDPVYSATVDDQIAYQKSRYGYRDTQVRREMKPTTDGNLSIAE